MKYISGPMEDFSKKFRLIFLPYLILLAACMVGYSFFNWYVYLRKESMAIPEWMMLIAAPLVVAVVVVLIWLRPRIGLLADKIGNKGNERYNFNLMAIFLTTGPLILSQHLLLSATGQFKKIDIPSQIEKAGYARYYSVAQFSALKQYVQVTTTSSSSRRGGRTNYFIHIAMPLVDNTVFKAIPVPIDSTPTYNNLFPSRIIPKTWLCMTYDFDLSRRRKSRVHMEEQTVIDSYLKKFQELNFSDVTYMERLGINDHGKEYRSLIGNNYEMSNTQDLTILKVHFNTFENRSNYMRDWTILGTVLCATFFCLLMALTPWDDERLRAFEDKRR